MKKIGIITLFGYNNYGNRLQMFAVQSIYKELGFNSEVIKYLQESTKDPLIIQLKVLINKLLFIRTTLSQSYLKKQRIRNFKVHAKRHYKESKNYIDPLMTDPTFHEKYSFFSVGSDQIWGWFTHSISDFVFLKFAPVEKRITFSPSFGSSSIDDQYRSIFTKGLNGFENISVREQSGAEIVKDFTGRHATVLCDPTMCLSKKEWLQFAKVHQSKPKKKFILTYFLGDPSPKAVEILKHISDEFEIVHLNSFKSPKFYAITPSEWVDYINSASLLLTDSFHGVVFSILLHTPFVVYNRVGGEGMQTRITHVLEKFNMENRFEVSAIDSSLYNMDFSNTEELIRNEKSNAYRFLKLSLRK